MQTRRKGLVTIAIVVAIAALQGCDGSEVNSTASPVPSKAAQLLADINRYREQPALEPSAAAQRWFVLYDRAVALTADDSSMDAHAFDSAVIDVVGESSLLAALPPPAAWPAFRAEAGRRADVAKGDHKALALRYLSEVLTGDREAAVATLSALEGKDNRDDVNAARAALARIYGETEAQLSAIQLELSLPASDYDDVEIPDLVAMVGEARATKVLAEAMTSKRTFHIQGGEATRTLARRVALANLDHMRVAQWWLADSVEAAGLYEALWARFRAGAAQGPERDYEWPWRNAATYYFLQTVKTGRQAAAEDTLGKLSVGGDVDIPRAAVEALQRAQLNEPLFRFLDGLLARRPDLGVWDLYIEQAAYTGHSAAALTLIERLLGRKELSAELRTDLQSRRVAALLAADRIDDANAAFRELLAKPPATGEANLRARVQTAINAARAGRLLNDAKLADLGTGFLRTTLDLSLDEKSSRIAVEARQALYAELRSQGRGEQALEIAVRGLENKTPSFSEAMAHRMGVESAGSQAALVEAAAIHSAAGRHAEVLTLLAKSDRWGAADLADVLIEEDSQHQPLGAIVARALQATGDKAAALRVARATVAALPGRDAGYEVIAALDPSPAATFDALYAGDEYEERPLIWKASVLLAAGSSAEAEATVRRAIAVDPSDGEEGPNDRMRAYSVLAQILRAKGETAEAQQYANAVEAIRISEHGDEFHAAGLYERAFRTYRQALEKFSDAYCIQSRLAVQLNKQGRRREALEHYRRAYELMPSSFGRVESHCFGCESVFQGAESQTLAEQVFSDIIRKSPEKPQAHYLLAYLREQQGRYADAVQPLRAAVSLDAHYLNAWKRLHDLADKTYMEAGERDIARLKLLELDPLQRHAHYELKDVGQLAALWNGLERARALAMKLEPPLEDLYPLPASAALLGESNKDMPPEMRYMQRHLFASAASKGPAAALYEHVLVTNARVLMGLDPRRFRD